jgi:hypothetical protein
VLPISDGGGFAKLDDVLTAVRSGELDASKPT